MASLLLFMNHLSLPLDYTFWLHLLPYALVSRNLVLEKSRVPVDIWEWIATPPAWPTPSQIWAHTFWSVSWLTELYTGPTPVNRCQGWDYNLRCVVWMRHRGDGWHYGALLRLMIVAVSPEMASAAEDGTIYQQCFSCPSAVKTDFNERTF